MTKELEQACDEKWGKSQFDWTIGRSGGHDPHWFWFCGTNDRGRYLHEGQTSTAEEALLAIIAADKPEEPEVPTVTVRELIDKLSGFDENLTVRFDIEDGIFERPTTFNDVSNISQQMDKLVLFFELDDAVTDEEE